jgi:hypothetical protein
MAGTRHSPEGPFVVCSSRLVTAPLTLSKTYGESIN